MTAQIRTQDFGTPLIRDVRIRSGAATLSGRLTHPAGPPKAVVVLNGATGVKARYYHAFAEWLALKKGIACLTYDYRDFGASQTGDMRDSTAKMSDWGIHDQQAARDWIARIMPGVPIWVMGHSLGGFMLPFQSKLGNIARVITVASGPVHVADHPWPYQALARLFWFGHAPLATKMFGFLPGKKLGFGPDLPAGVYWQWRKWCTTRNFFSDDFGKALPYPDWVGVKCPVKVIAMADDDLVPPKAVWRLMDFYRDAHITQQVIRPSDHGLSNIGHIGAFSPENSKCWDSLIA